VVGPTTSVSSSVQTSLRVGAKAVRRVSGRDVAATAVALTNAYAKRLGSGPVTLVNGGALADLLQAGSLGRGVLVTDTAAMPPATAAWVRAHPGTKARIVGPPAIVASTVVAAIGK
jgi:hypothetical protein